VHVPLESVADLPLTGLEPIGGYTTGVCDVWPVRCRTYGYLPSHKASPPIGWYQIMLTTCPGLHWWQGGWDSSLQPFDRILDTYLHSCFLVLMQHSWQMCWSHH